MSFFVFINLTYIGVFLTFAPLSTAQYTALNVILEAFDMNICDILYDHHILDRRAHVSVFKAFCVNRYTKISIYVEKWATC